MKILAVFGPTGVGKTDAVIELAKCLAERGEKPVAVSADALQVYKGLDVLTNKPTAAQLEQLEHLLISFVPVEDEFNAYLYSRAAHREIDRLIEEGIRPIVVGGTGLYLRAALAELDMRPTGRSEKSQLWSTETRLPTLLFGLSMEREALYKQIDERVDQMIAGEVRDEVQAARQIGVSRTARKAIGFDLLGRDSSDESVAAEMKRATRNYAKRQLTWMRKMPNVTVLDRTELSPKDVANNIVARID